MSEMPMKSSLPAPGTGTLVYAHRGAMAYAPQNTMPSFELAWEMGAHGIELDVQCARDGVPVVFHDDEIGSLTGGQGAIRDHDLAEIRKLDAGSHFSKKFAGEKIPLFEDVLRARPAGTFINIELKTKMEEDSILRQMLRPITGYPALDFGMDGGREAEARRVAQATADCISRVAGLRRSDGILSAAGYSSPESGPELVSHLIVSSFDPVALVEFSKVFPGIPLAFLYYGGVHFDTRVMMEKIGHQAWHPYLRETGSSSVRAAHGLGRLVNCWTVNRPSDARRLVSIGVDGLITNYPDVMMTLVNDR